MLYVQQSLGQGEELVHVGHFHWMYTLRAIMGIVWGVLLCLTVLVGAIFIETKSGFNLSTHGYDPTAGWLDQVRALHPAIKLAAFFMLIMGLIRFAHMMVIKVTTEIAVTTSRIVYKRGLVARYVGEMSIDRIEGVNVLQGIIGRIFNYGSVIVRGMGIGEVILPQIADPVAFRKAIDRARNS